MGDRQAVLMRSKLENTVKNLEKEPNDLYEIFVVSDQSDSSDQSDEVPSQSPSQGPSNRSTWRPGVTRST